ncbi:MAG: hypothetical protein ACLGGV_02625 [Bacteroidia bacterium]
MENRKININRPNISSEEILKRRNFQEVLTNYQLITKPFYKTPWFGVTSSSMLITAVILGVFIFNESETSNKKKPVVATHEDSTKKELVSYKEDAPCIFPPIKNKGVEYNNYKINADKNETITHSTGSKITIPKGSMVDKKGNAVSGEVEIRYREFHDQVDILLSGIPMTYDSLNTTYTFESAGMVQIFGYQNGEEVFVNPNKPIKVEMQSRYEGTKYNLYELDTVQRNWVNKGKDEVKSEKLKVEFDDVIAIDEEDYQKELFNKQNVKTTYAVKEQKREELVAVQKEVKKIEKTEPIKPKQVDETKFHFDIEVDENQFPEIAVYQSMLFEVLPGEKISPNDADKQWNNIELKKAETQNQFIIHLTSPKEERLFKAQPVFKGEDLVKANKVFEQKFAEYSKKLDTRKQEEAQKQKEYEEAKAKWEEAKNRLEAQQRAMAEAQVVNAHMNKNADKIYRTFNVTRFGTWNCDSPISQPRGREVLAKFKHKITKGIIAFPVLMLIEKARNAVFRLDGERTQKFTFNPSENNILIGFLPSGEMAIFKPEDFKKIQAGTTNFEFEMHILNPDDFDTEELKKLILG